MQDWTSSAESYFAFFEKYSQKDKLSTEIHKVTIAAKVEFFDCFVY